jgi:CelD/BcsL family acetyltransferase involved in cellulose biosynthesis
VTAIDEMRSSVSPGGALQTLSFEPIRPDRAEIDRMDAFPDRVLFQSPEWLRFLAITQHGTPVTARIHADGEHVGYFTGVVVRRFGVRILGSPFPGWTTEYMGFNLEPGVDRGAAAAALADFAFGPLRCHHLELKDRELADDLAELGFASSPTLTFVVDLTGEESDVFARMSSACRRAVRKATKSGVTVEETTELGFADEYYGQLRQVFARQGLVPTYPVERVREVIRCLAPEGRILCLRAIAPDGRCIATAIFPAGHGTAYFWGGASLRDDQILRPNEMLFWHAMQYWRQRGMGMMDLGGGGEYKRRYGARELRIPAYRRSRNVLLPALREAARNIFRKRQQYLGRRARELT